MLKVLIEKSLAKTHDRESRLDAFARVELDRWVILKIQPTHNRKNQAGPGKQKPNVRVSYPE